MPLREHLRLVVAHGAAVPGGSAASQGEGDRSEPRSGEPEADDRLDLERLFRAYSPLVATISLRILGSRDEMQDMVQDVFLELSRWLDRIEDAAAVRSWLTTVTVREARRRLRRRRLKALLGLGETPDYRRVADSSASPAVRTLLAEVYRVLDRVDVEDRLAWTLRHVARETLPEVAEHCGCSLATAKRRIARAHSAILNEVTDV
jgi:RNA polymerase sigma-70 factor (ECF subfamily)